jgi:hypothetical protein
LHTDKDFQMNFTLTAARRPLIAATVCLGGFVAVAMMTVPTPAEAKNRTCASRADECMTRCRKASDGDSAASANCTQRTCNHQFNQCVMSGSLPSGVNKGDRDPRPPRGGTKVEVPMERPMPKRGPRGGVSTR